ncbi:hypothetical protein [Pedobacter sp. MW01-1-1]|uniref:hypothetical protein n=1 Tax=Pedobacter sp. MW01-1-1 TaxID=3383027 RepID=UPI003FF05360
MIKKILCYGCVIAFLSSCTNGTKTSKQVDSTTHDSTTVVTTETDSLSSLNALVGKYPQEVKLLENPVLKTRLETLLGKEFSKLQENWNTETPIIQEGTMLHTSGCKQHECPVDAYDLYIDTQNDILNVYNFRNDTLTVYTEKNQVLTLPEHFAEELKIKKENAKIK